MKATGIVRKIDELGRVVIPKEIRRTLRIRDGEPLEIFTDHDGEVILKKYSPINDLNEFAREYTESLYQSMGHVAAISDKDVIISVCGAGRKELADKMISEDLVQIMKNKEKVVCNRSVDPKFYAITADEDESVYTAQVISPILTGGETIGLVILLSKDGNVRMGQTELKVAETASEFIGKQMEQ